MSRKPEPRYVTPTLESITIRAKYKIPETDFSVVCDKIIKELEPVGWLVYEKIGESVELLYWSEKPQVLNVENWEKNVRSRRSGVPVHLVITTVEHNIKSILVEVECHPAMWSIIAQTKGEETSFTENEVQEALLECKRFVKQVMSIFKGKEIEPASVYPIIPRSEIKSRLLNLGLKEIVDKLDKAEEHIVQNDFPESLKSSRTAFEKMIDWQMKKRGLKKTDNYKNDLERLRSRGHLDPETTQLLQSYYRCLSDIGVHEKGTPAGIYEAQMGFGITLIMLDYFANKLP